MGKYTDKEIIHSKKGDIEYLEFNALKDLKHCITLRHGGFSENEHESLNFRIYGTDKKENVLKNVEIVKEELGFSNIYKSHQAHTDRVISINDDNKDNYEFGVTTEETADGYIINEKKIATMITTADCNPIIIYDPKNEVCANVHAGWKGVINGIYINAINIMEEKYNSNIKDLIICIGPSIRKCCFTSKEESFKEKFTEKFKYEEEYLEYEVDKETFHIDLIKILKKELNNAGIMSEQIHVADICTRCNTEDFFSYRHSVQNKIKDYGVMGTIVELK